MTEEALSTPGRRAWAAHKAMDEATDSLNRVIAELRQGAVFADGYVRMRLLEWAGALERPRLELDDACRVLAADVDPPAVPPEPALHGF